MSRAVRQLNYQQIQNHLQELKGHQLDVLLDQWVVTSTRSLCQKLLSMTLFKKSRNQSKLVQLWADYRSTLLVYQQAGWDIDRVLCYYPHRATTLFQFAMEGSLPELICICLLYGAKYPPGISRNGQLIPLSHYHRMFVEDLNWMTMPLNLLNCYDSNNYRYTQFILQGMEQYQGHQSERNPYLTYLIDQHPILKKRLF